jgi:hypothetical protein
VVHLHFYHLTINAEPLSPPPITPNDMRQK